MSGPSDYQPSHPALKWIERRLPIMGFMHASFVAYPTPRNLNYWWTFGAILSFMLVVQIVTGVILAMHYTPNADLAFRSVELIVRDVNYGWLLRNMHAAGASMFFFAVYIHMFRGVYYGSYKEPREVLWILGVIIYLLMMATGFMGYVLPWGQMSFWGATVITNLFSAIPYVGDSIVTLLWGGYSVGNPTLNRFFSLHYLLPFLIAGVVVLHVWALHVAGQGNPAGVEPKTEKDTVPFTPYATIKDMFGVSVFLLLFSWFIFYMPNYLGDADNYIPANPGVTPAHIVPEWYYLPFYAILRSIPNKLAGVIAMFSAILVLVFLPWLDTAKTRSCKYRPLAKQFFWIFVIVCILLGYLGAQPPEGIYVIAGRVLTVCYFAYFLIILPLLSRIERPRPLPNSIADDVLAKTGRKTTPMVSTVIALMVAGGLFVGGVRSARAEDLTPPAQKWSFAGPFGTFDRGALQRGLKVYKEVCSNCHALSYIAFRNLGDVGGP
ncbi:MAG: cytochrome b N-terminal domain-containing protein, partial [Gemmatimonas sp.]